SAQGQKSGHFRSRFKQRRSSPRSRVRAISAQNVDARARDRYGAAVRADQDGLDVIPSRWYLLKPDDRQARTFFTFELHVAAPQEVTRVGTDSQQAVVGAALNECIDDDVGRRDRHGWGYA